MKSKTYQSIFEPRKLAEDKRKVLLSDVVSLVAEDPHDAAIALRANAQKSRQGRDGEEISADSLRLAVCYSLLADFVEQGWLVSVSGSEIEVKQPSLDELENESEAQVKQRIRKGFEAVSNRQLNDPSNRDFIKRMETGREYQGRVVSILDLIDDGADLANQLASLTTLPDEQALQEVGRFIHPEIVECRGDQKCLHTGYRLQDIWRYFRHTWSLEYKLLPGRTMRFLVRNASRPNHPIIGIVLLSSPTANLLSRDKWIGWTMNGLIAGLLDGSHDANVVGQRVFGAIKAAIKEIRTDDLLPPSALNHPRPEHFFTLDQLVHKATGSRANDLSTIDVEAMVDIRGLNKQKITNPVWKELSQTSLYVKKRAEQLVPLLKALRTMKGFGFEAEPGAAIYEALIDRDGKSAIKTALNEMKKVHLASEVADLSVCGAVAPYNRLIGGKLVASLMASNSVRDLYRDRYGKQVSEIASQIKGRRVTRSAELKLLTTTALYGVGSNQYSSLVLRSERNPELESDLTWKKIDSSEGFTVTHIGDETVNCMRALSAQVYGRKRINSVFGEGSSPRTRQIREGLNLIGINNDDLLRQPNKKKVYVCELFPGARETLLGFNSEGMGSEAQSNSTSSIFTAWARRWLIPRISQPRVLDALAKDRPEHVSSRLKARADMHAEVRSN